MLTKRIIPCLDVKDGRVVKGVSFVKPGVRVQQMPTLYGPLSFSARTQDEHTFRCEIGPGVAATIELRPPLSGRLVGVTVNGVAHEDFDPLSAIIPCTPAEIVCHVSVT